MNNNRPSKPNLPSVPKPSKLLALTRLRWTFVFSSLPASVIAHSFNQYEIGPFLTASQAPNDLLTDVGMVRKGFGNEPFKDVTMERIRVEKFEESLCENCGWINLVFL